jgi:hypothetical protein
VESKQGQQIQEIKLLSTYSTRNEQIILYYTSGQQLTVGTDLQIYKICNKNIQKCNIKNDGGGDGKNFSEEIQLAES